MLTNDYLDAAKHSLGIESDYELARRFSVRKEEISQVRRNIKPLPPFIAGQISDVTGIPLEQIIADVEANDRNPTRAAYWKERAARHAAALLLPIIAIGSLAVMPKDSYAAGESYEVSRPSETLTASGFASLFVNEYTLCAPFGKSLPTRLSGLTPSILSAAG